MISLRRHPLSFLSGTLVAVFFLSCANQIPPAGGPLDTEGPRVVYVYPEPYSLNVRTQTIEIEFDEYVDKRSAMESVFISPRIEEIEYDWWGTTLELSFESALQENTTYVVSIGTDVTDLEPSRKNRLERAFSFPFSTGSSIDRGLIAGRVLPKAPEDEMGGVMVYAYRIPTGNADTLNVLQSSPTYVTQAGRDGTFAFPHIRLDPYFILSIRDASRNIVYDREEDEYAVPVGPVRLSSVDTSFTGLILQLAQEDTTAPRMTDVSPIDLNHIRADISEPLDSASDRRPVALLIDTTTGEQRTVYTVSPILPRMNQLELTTDFLDPDAAYRLTLSGMYDKAGNMSRDGASSVVFSPEAVPDTLPPSVLSISVRDSATEVAVGEEVQLRFTEPISQEGWSSDRVTLLTMPDMASASVRLRWITESILGISTMEEFRSYTWYQLSVLLFGLQDWKLEQLSDSLRVIHFRTEDVYDTGTIEGTVSEGISLDTLGSIRVVARPVDGKPEDERSLDAHADGSFSASRLKPGLYTMYGYKDRNGNESFDPGRPYPYLPAERRSDWTDTLKVRSRWPLEGVRIRIP